MYIASNVFNITRYELTANNFEPELTSMNSLFRLYKTDGSYHLIFLPQYPMGESVIIGDEIGTYTNVEIMNTFEVNNITYQNVYHTRIVVSSTNTEYNYWIAKYHSLIKATSIIDGQTTSISLKSDHLLLE
jgi:hypothetical protein